jgi:hypothetical protein
LPEIHVATRNTRFGALGRRGPRGPVGPPYKSYPNAARAPLPAIDPSAAPPGRSFAEAVNNRAPFVGFAGEPLSVAQLSLLLHCCNGVTGRYPVGDQFLPLRAAPSAGANYAGEVYVVVERVRGLPPGRVWSPEHGHYHDVDGGETRSAARSVPRPPGPAPPGKVWSPDHGHWHDAR